MVAAPVGLILAGIGQLLLLRNPSRPGLALAFYALAIGLFVWCSGKLGLPAAEPRFPALAAPRRPALKLLATSLVLSLYAALRVNRELTPAEDYLLVAAWVLSIGAYVWSVLQFAHWRMPPAAVLVAAWRARWRETLLVAALFGLALTVRTYDLELHPYAFVNDEGEVGRSALRILSGETTNLFETGWSGQPNWSFVPTALAVALLGNTATAARLVSAIEGALAVVFVYLLGREAFDRRAALMAALVLAGLPWHIHFSRLAFNNVIDSFFAAGVLWLLYRALRRGHLLDYLWAGLATGLTVYSYLGSRLVAVLALGLLAFAWLRRRLALRTHLRHLLVYAGGAAVVSAPMLSYFYQHSGTFMGRLNAENIFINGWLQSQAAQTGQSQAAVLLEQLQKSALVFVAGGAPGHFFSSPRPYLPALAAVFFVLALGYSAWRSGQLRYLMLAAWFWLVVVLGSTLTVGPPSHQRLIMSAPAAALLVALGLREAARLAERLRLAGPRLALALSVAVAGLTGLQGTVFYFGEYRGGHYFEDASNDFSYEVASLAGALGAGYRVYLLGAPSVYAVFGDFHYLAPEVEVVDFNQVTAASVASLPRDRDAFFVAVPSRLEDLRRVARWLPGGEWREVTRRYQAPQMLYFSYRLEREAWPEPPTDG